MNKVALVIGINDYDHFENLDKCLNDANDINDFLEKTGFEVTLLLNPKQNDLQAAIKTYKEKIKNDTIAVFYYSGHGLQVDQYNFLVPTDSEIKTPEDIGYNSTNISNLFTDIPDDLDFTHIVILDACRKNPFNTGLEKITAGIGLDAPRKGTIIAYAASPGKPSSERPDDKNGVFTKHLLNNLPISNISIEQVFKNTRTDVLHYTNDKQLTWEESSLHGNNFSFNVEEEAVLEFQETIDKFLVSKSNLLFQDVVPFLKPKYFHLLPIEHLHLALAFAIIAFEDEENEKVTRTVDGDYFNYELLETHLPLYQTRVKNEDECDNIFGLELFNKIGITKNINYGFNEVLSGEEAFPHFMSNHISFEGKEGILSCFLSFEGDEHIIKPMIYLKSALLEIICFSALKGAEAVAFLKAYVNLRTPFEKKVTNLMDGFKEVKIGSIDELMALFKEDGNEKP